MTLFCIICGCSEEEVEKLFCFPRNSEKSKLWQQSLGMVYQEQISGHVRLCNRHFESTCFKPFVSSLLLYPDAIPTLLAARPTPVQVCQDLPSTSAGIFESNSPPLLADLSKSGTSVQSPSLRKQSVFSGMQRICSTSTSNKEKHLISIIKKKDMHLRKLKKKCKERGVKIRDLTNIHKSVEVSNIFKGLSPAAAQFMVAQIRCSKRSPHGRRWTLDDKITSLAIYKRSPKCYTLLRRLISLPSIRTLTSLLEKVPFDVGINEHIFKHLGDCLNKCPEKERLCSLAFDEMAIREHIQYNPAKDCIEGVEDFGHYRTNKLANYALVFFAQGIAKSWKQPVAYYFSHGGVTSSELEAALKDVLRAITKENIPVVATICDMGSANVKTLKNMGSDVSHPYFVFEEKRIYTIFDIPHLLKCFRNLFRKYNILIPTIGVDGKEETLQARWSDIEKAYEEDKKNPLIFRSLYKIKDNYLEPLRQNAMKVKVAAQTLSRSVSVYIYNLVRQGILPSRALATATFANDIDQLFDSCNASARKGPDGKPFKCMVTEDSGHVSFWEESYEKIKKWIFIRKPDDVTSSKHWKPPSQTGWLHNLKALPQIWQYLKSIKLDALRTRTLNQDGLENLFGAIRSGCGCNENPTTTQFVSSLKTQLINGLANQDLKGSNCEEDEMNLLSSLRSFLKSGTDKSQPHSVPNVSNMDPVTPLQTKYSATDIEQLVLTGSIESLSVAYVSGFIIKKIFSNFTCESCKNALCSDDLQPCNQFISLREFSDDKNKLFYPSEKFVVAVGQGITLLEINLPTFFREVNIKKRILAILEETINFSWLNNSCATHSEHIKKCALDSICHIGIPWYCKRVVRDLRSQIKTQRNERKIKKLQHM